LEAFNKLCQIVDTIKLHFYHGEETRQDEYNKYLKFTDDLKTLKEEAQLIHHTDNSLRFVNTYIGGTRFQVMATTIRGFGVTIQNQDVSISFKIVKPETNIKVDNDSDALVLTPNPIIKVEFRASYLARVGHVEAINFVIRLLEHHVISNYQIKISELHLATDIQGYDFELLDYYRFKTRKRKNGIHDQDQTDTNTYYYQGRKFTGFVFGQGDEMLRIYNKSVEIKKNPDKAFIKDFAWVNNKDFDEYRDVWRIEIQYRRAKLKTLYTSKNGILDGFANVLEEIPSLWDRALDKVEMLDISHESALDFMLGYKIIDGEKYPIENNTLKMRIKRAVTHDLWSFLKGWFHYESSDTNVYTAPKTGSFRWVSNSIKSLFSTMLKYEGDLSPELIEEAFTRANTETIAEKKLSLIDNAYINTMSYLGECEIHTKKNGIYMSGMEQLSKNVAYYIKNAVNNIVYQEDILHVADERLAIFQKEELKLA